MFIILPVAHEQQTVQRLPWITFGLIAVNIIIFLITHANRNDIDQNVNEKFEQFLTYYIDHPYLEFPEKMKSFLGPGDEEEIESLYINAIPPSDEEELANEQQELEKFADQVLVALNDDPFRHYGYVPGNPTFWGLIGCMFLHDGYFHLLGNMLFLFLAGCAIEDIWGRPLYIAFYFISGIVATLSHQVFFSESMVPLIGASGAIAGVMGAFLIRLAKTKIRFFYLIWLLFFGIRTGTFLAPAYIVLPLWLLEQFAYASFDDEAGGVAVWAHIGGFLFGVAIALVMKFTGFEEKFIAPAIEKKVSLEQNPLFLKGMQLSENKDYAGALICLQKVVREDPNHYEAFMEMRRIAEVTGDRSGYNRNTAAILELVLRSRDYDLFVDLYASYKDHAFRDTLPARTLLAIANFFDEQNDSLASANHLEELVLHHSADPLAMKAYSRLARIYMEKMNERTRAIESYRESYFHPQSTQDWRNGLLLEMKKYGLVFNDLGSAPLLPADASSSQTQTPVNVVSVLPSTPTSFVSSPASSAVKQTNIEPMLIPSPLFDGSNGNLNVVSCQIEKIGLKGLILSTGGKQGQLPWKRIRAISVASLQNLRTNGSPLIVDWIAQPLMDENKRVIYRTFGSEINFTRIFPHVDQSFDEAFRNFVGIVLRNSGARCLPDAGRCLGPSFLVFPGMDEYENYLQGALQS